MARICSKTGKKGSTGNLRSHSLRATKRTFKANIVKKRVFDPKTGKYVRIKVATSYLRTLAKRMQAGKKA
jgi:large subunit ribosomal protein L28